MMLNQHGESSKPFAVTRRSSEEPGGGRQPMGRALALGAPLSASFMGLLVLRGGEAAAAGDDSGMVPGAVRPGASPSWSDGAVAGGSGAVSFGWLGLGVSSAAAATSIGEDGVFDPAALTAFAAAVDHDAPAPEAADALAAAGGPSPESVPPAPAAVGDVTVAFGSEAPFELAVLTTPEPGTPDENRGDLGDPRLIDRSPIFAETEVPDGGADDDGDAPTGGDGGGTVVGQRITGTNANDYISGTAGNDVIDVVGGRNTVLAGAGDDVVHGGPGSDTLRGGLGNDTIYGRAGNNDIHGEEGDDTLYGGTGNDTLRGGSGNDRLDGVAGVNRLEGGTGDDTLVINDPRDIAIETNEGPDGGGNDTLEVAAGFGAALRGRFASLAPDGTATFVLGSEPGRVFPDGVNGYMHQVNPHIENLRLTGNDAHDAVGDGGANVIHGNAGDNLLYGGGGDDVLYAGGGDNVLDGGAGNDILHAGTGADLLYGGPGADTLFVGSGESELHGGEGDDLYVFGLAEGGRGTIFDHQGVNRLRFDGLEDPVALQAQLDGEDLVLGHEGADIVRIADYAGQRDAFAGVEVEGELISLERFLEAGMAPAASPAAVDDFLALYLGPQSVDAPDDILDPAWLADDGPAHDAPFALYEHGAGGASTAAPAVADPAASWPDDLLGSFMRSEPLWIGPEDGAYLPDAGELPLHRGEDAHQARA